MFLFNKKGDLVAFEASRYYGGNTNATLENWLIETISFKEFNGLRIPNKSTVIWKLSEGDFNWLKLEVTAIEFNPSKLFT